MKSILTAILCAAALASSPALADAWKDESGKQWRDDYGSKGWSYDQDDGPWRYGRHPQIPYGHLPPPGECRAWYWGVPPGHQPPPERC